MVLGPPTSECELSNLLHGLRGTLVVSCQADAGTPLADPAHLSAMAAAVVAGGASAIRTEGLANIAAIRARVSVPVIGLVKRAHPGTEIYITPTLDDVRGIAEAGADVIAFDATSRPRPVHVANLVEAAHAAGRLAMADISTVDEARAALAAGADVVSTTMAGYTSYSKGDDGPDFGLMRALQTLEIPFVAEGRVWTVEDAQKCVELGATFIVVGSAITRPTLITERFARSISADTAAPLQRKA
jgi:N-acylglucosamine-6-phosphate 2-epimerase